MSYTRRFSRSIPVHYSGSVSYPPSKSGGSVSYSGTTYEEVEVVIDVDTTPFDSSVANCNNTVNGLTASVGAMNAAQCLAISQNADKVSKTIIDGFFHTVRTDLSTQRAELEQTISARLLLLQQQAKSLSQKRDDMEEHYTRTSARYHKTFEELNKELAARIHALDENVFRLVKSVEEQSDRMLHTDLVQTAVTLNKENGIAQSQLNVATMKNHALHAMHQMENFLTSKARSELTMKEATIDGTGDDGYLMPICFMESVDESHQINRLCVVPEQYASLHQQLSDKVESAFESTETRMEELEKMQLRSYMQEEIAHHLSADDAHTHRVRVLINNMFNELTETL